MRNIKKTEELSLLLLSYSKHLKIAIIGTRGIPNNYGGFEQFAEYLSIGLVNKGHQVYVYNSHNHPHQENLWKGVHIIHKYDPEFKFGTVGQFIYDLNCIRDSRKRKFDIILNLGYTSSSIWGKLFPKRSIVITNMDGLEWKRTKYSKKVQQFLLYAEKLATQHSQILVADSLAIKDYLLKKYRLHAHFIAYGSELFLTPNEDVLKIYQQEAYCYNLIIARMEPENNIEVILDGISQSITKQACLVVGNTSNQFGNYLINKYKHDTRIVFIGAIYDNHLLNNLRYFCNIYFHGHSVGGTNPSLLEAMACKCFIAAHDNPFNKSVLDVDALFFNTVDDVKKMLEVSHLKQNVEDIIQRNCEKIKMLYSWSIIINQYEQLMFDSLKK